MYPPEANGAIGPIAERNGVCECRNSLEVASMSDDLNA